jgi:hypothetical protein
VLERGRCHLAEVESVDVAVCPECNSAAYEIRVRAANRILLSAPKRILPSAPKVITLRAPKRILLSAPNRIRSTPL